MLQKDGFDINKKTPLSSDELAEQLLEALSK
jgi:hypothetical protein